jgi:hypothetical protein
MKKVVITISAAIFALGLTTAGLAQTAQTPAKPEVKQESTTVQTPAAKPEAAKPEVTKPVEKAGAKEAIKPGEAKKETTKEAKKVAKQEAKKAKTEKKSGAPVEKSQPEKQ